MPGRRHRHDDLADALVRRAVARRAADQIAVVGDGGEAGPDLLPVDHPLVAVAPGRRLQARQVAARLRFGHPDAPRGLAGEDAGEELGLLIGATEGDQGRPHLPVGEPHRRDRGARGDQLLADDQPLDGRPAAAAVLDGPGEPDPAEGGELLGELGGEAVDPRVVGPAEPGDGVGGDLPGLVPQRVLLRRPGEVHRRRGYAAERRLTSPPWTRSRCTTRSSRWTATR